MAREGNVLKGIEDFEESILDPNDIDHFDDPLESGVPNGPFLNGLTGLPNLRVQSNLGGGDPSDENPRGFIGFRLRPRVSSIPRILRPSPPPDRPNGRSAGAEGLRNNKNHYLTFRPTKAGGTISLVDRCWDEGESRCCVLERV